MSKLFINGQFNLYPYPGLTLYELICQLDHALPQTEVWYHALRRDQVSNVTRWIYCTFVSYTLYVTICADNISWFANPCFGSVTYDSSFNVIFGAEQKYSHLIKQLFRTLNKLRFYILFKKQGRLRICF